ncbi:hypothetical protein KCU61_g405, partial [Aureobasidium melanogenum]
MLEWIAAQVSSLEDRLPYSYDNEIMADHEVLCTRDLLVHSSEEEESKPSIAEAASTKSVGRDRHTFYVSKHYRDC